MSRKINPLMREIIANRKCCVCGKGTHKSAENRIHWNRDLDEYGKWTGKWRCHNCYSKEYVRERKRQNDKKRAMVIKKKMEEGKI